jgi:hypothetical protein
MNEINIKLIENYVPKKQSNIEAKIVAIKPKGEMLKAGTELEYG